MKDLTLAFTIIIKGCIANKMTPEQMASQLNEHVQHEVKKLNIPAVIKSVCEHDVRNFKDRQECEKCGEIWIRQ